MENKGIRKDIVWRRIDSLRPFERNNKAHSPDQIALVARSINEHGFVQPIVVDKDGVIICGHCRHLAVQQLLLTEVPVIIADHLDDNQVRKLRILDNRANEAPWNLDTLRFELTGLDQAGIDLRDVGFPKDTIGDFLDTGFLPDSVFDTRALGTEFAEPATKQKPESDERQKEFLVSVICRDLEEQTNVFESLIGQGLLCKPI